MLQPKVPYFLTPRPYAILFVFLLLTSLHLYSNVLMRFHFEACLLIAILVTAGLEVMVFRTEAFPPKTDLFVWICLLLVGAPLVSSLLNGEGLAVAFSSEYHSWAKAVLIAPVLYVFFSGQRREALVDMLLLAIGVLALIFWYRYLALQEIREYDARPLLKMKNGDPNFLSVLFGTLLPLVVYRLTQKTSVLKKALLSLLLLLLISCLIALQSRMGIVSLFVALAYLTTTLPSSYRRLGMALLVALAGLCLLYGSLFERFVHLADQSNQMRLRSMWNGLLLFASSPLVGHGWGAGVSSFYEHSGYPRLVSETFPLDVHNTPLQVLAEMGAYGFAAFSLFFGFLFLQIRRGPRPLSQFVTAAFLVLVLNLMALPLQSKDFVLLLAAALAAISSSKPSSLKTHEVVFKTSALRLAPDSRRR